MASFSGSTCRNLAMMRSEIYHALSNINYPLRHCASFRWFPVANRRDPTISSPERQLNSIWSLGVVSLQKVIYDSLLALVKNPQSSNSMGWEEWGERKKPCCYQICFKFERISKMINNSTKPYINTSIHQYSSCENETCVKRVWNVCENVWVISLCVLWHCELVESSSHRLVEPRLHLFSSDLETSTAPSSRENPGSSWDLRPASRLTGWLRHAKYIESFTSLSERYQFWIHKNFTDICDIFWHFCIASCCHIVMQWYLTLDDSAAPWPLWDQGKKSSEFVVFLRWHTSDAAPLVTKTSTWPYMFFIFLKCFKETVTRSLEHDGHNVTLPRQQKIWRQKDAWNVQPGHDTSPRNLSLKEGFTQHANLMRCVRGAVQCQCHILSKYQ